MCHRAHLAHAGTRISYYYYYCYVSAFQHEVVSLQPLYKSSSGFDTPMLQCLRECHSPVPRALTWNATGPKALTWDATVPRGVTWDATIPCVVTWDATVPYKLACLGPQNSHNGCQSPLSYHTGCHSPQKQFMGCPLVQILVEKSLIEGIGLEWAGLGGSTGNSTAPAAAASHIAVRNHALLTQRMESNLAASRNSYSLTSPGQYLLCCAATLCWPVLQL